MKFEMLLLLAVLVCINSTGAESDTSGTIEGPRWIIVPSVTGGLLQNTTRFKIKVPQGASGTVEYEEHIAELTDEGYGGGVTAVGFYRNVSFTNVNFYFPDVNQSKIFGSISALSATFPTGEFWEPYLGLGFAFVNTDTDFDNFRYSLRQELYGRMAIGYAEFPSIKIDNSVFAPYPKAGLKFNIPIHHWYITPFYSYLYEWVYTHARSGGGHVEVYYEGDREAGLAPQLEVNVDAFDSNNPKEYAAHLAGTEFLIDFHYFLQLRGSIYYNLTRNLLTSRFIGSMLLNRYLGITLYYEYTEKTTVTNSYFLIGPSFIIGPGEFFDRIFSKRKGKK